MTERATEPRARAACIRTVLFDLDGTLADTAPDLAHALNTLLSEHGRQPLPYARIRAEASHGARALIRLGFGAAPEDPAFATLRARFLTLYEADICTRTTLFPGMREVLDALGRRGLKIGIVTNKPAFLTDCLVKALGLDAYTDCVVSGDTTANAKPHPEPMLYACAKTGSRPEQCVYVGDAARDIEAGRAAGMPTLAASFGYLRTGEDPRAWGADAVVHAPADILAWLDADAVRA